MAFPRAALSTLFLLLLGGTFAALISRWVAAPWRPLFRNLRNFLWIAALPCGLWSWLITSPLPPANAARAGFTPLFPGYRDLPLHAINQPADGKRRIVLLGASHIACWGGDYRSGFSDFRHKHDFWGRASLAVELERQLRQCGIPTRVDNLGINSGDIAVELALFLYALDHKPDLIVHGLVAPSFCRFDPNDIPEVTRELPARLARWSYPGKAELEKSLLASLGLLPRGRLPTIHPTLWDGVCGAAGRGLLHAQQAIGLPPLVIKLQQPSAKETREIVEIKMPAWYRPLMENALGDGINLPVMMDRIAREAGSRYIVVLAPLLGDLLLPFEREFTKRLRARGVTVIDLATMPLRHGPETYDGTHRTPEGNRLFADRLLDDLAREQLFP